MNKKTKCVSDVRLVEKSSCLVTVTLKVAPASYLGNTESEG
jgi:hypothetical protein